MKKCSSPIWYCVIISLLLSFALPARAQQTDSSLATPLMWAAYKGNLPLFKQLVKKGADPRKKGTIYLDSTRVAYYGNILGIAAAKNDIPLLLYCLDSLSINASDPEYNPQTKRDNGWLPIHWASSRGHWQSVEILLNHGANAGVADIESGKTPVLLAAEQGHYELVNHLLEMENGASGINAKNKYSWQLIHYVCRDINSLNWISVLKQKGAHLNEQESSGWTPLMIAALYGNPHTFATLLSAGADTARTDTAGKMVRQLAAEARRYTMIVLLDRFSKGAKLNQMLLTLDSIRVAADFIILADSCKKAGSNLHAMNFYKDRLNILNSVYGNHHPLYIEAANNLSDLLRLQKSDKARLIMPEAHTDRVIDLNYSSDGKYLVSASLDLTARLWEVNGGRLVHTFSSHKEALTAARFSPDDSKVITTARDDMPLIWDSRTGAKIAGIGPQLYLNCYCEATFSNDGKTILTTALKDGAAKFDAQDGKLLKTLDFDTASLVISFGLHKNCQLEFARYSPDNKYLVVGSKSSRLYVWDAVADTLLHTLTGHTGNITSVQISASSRYLLTTSEDSTAKIWFLPAGTLHSNFTFGDKLSVTAAAFSSDNKLLVLAGSDSSIVFYDLMKEKLIRKVDNRAIVKSILFSKSDLFIATAGEDNYIGLWDSQRCNIIKQKKFDRPIDAMAFRPDGKELALSSGYSIFLHSTLDLALIKELSTEIFDNKILAVSPDGSRFISTAYCTDYSLRVWDLPGGNLAEDIGDHADMVRDAVYSKDGKLLISCADDKTIRIWNTESWKCVNILRPNEAARMLRISNNGKYLAAFFAEGYIRVYKTESMEQVFVRAAYYQMYAMEFGPGDTTLICAIGSGRFRIFNFIKNKLLFETGITKQWGGYNYGQIDVDSRQGYVLLNFYGSAKVIDAKTFQIVDSFQKSYVSPVVAIRFGRSHKEIITVHANERSSLVHLGTDSVELLGPPRETNKSGMDDYRRNTSASYGIANTPDWRYVIALNDSLRVIDLKTKKIIYQAKAEDFALMDSGRIVLYNDRGRFFAYSILHKEPIAQIISMNKQKNGFVTILENGYFRGEKNCINKLNYADDNHLFGLSQFDIKYNRPDKILAHLQKYFPRSRQNDLMGLYRKAYFKRLNKMDIDTAAIQGNAVYPVCEMVNSGSKGKFDFSTTLKIFAYDSLSSLHSFNVLVNDVPIYGRKGILIQNSQARLFDTTIDIKLTDGINIVKPVVINKQGFESNTASQVLRPDAAVYHHYDNYSDSLNLPPVEFKVALKSEIYFIGIGIDRFADKAFNLQWSVKDIRDMALKFKKKNAEIIIDTLFNKEVTLANVKALKQKLLTLNESDKVIIAFSGHGVINKQLDYFLSTYDINFNHPEKNGLPYEELENLLDGIRPRQKLLLIDACHSGEIDKEAFNNMNSDSLPPGVKGIIINGRKNESAGLENSFLLMQSLFMNAGRSSGTTVIAAAAGTQYAYERDNLRNGVFTYSILEAMDDYESLTVHRLRRIVEARVQQLTNKLQRPAARSETMNHNWNIW